MRKSVIPFLEHGFEFNIVGVLSPLGLEIERPFPFCVDRLGVVETGLFGLETVTLVLLLDSS